MTKSILRVVAGAASWAALLSVGITSLNFLYQPTPPAVLRRKG